MKYVRNYIHAFCYISGDNFQKCSKCSINFIFTLNISTKHFFQVYIFKSVQKSKFSINFIFTLNISTKHFFHLQRGPRGKGPTPKYAPEYLCPGGILSCGILSGDILSGGILSGFRILQLKATYVVQAKVYSKFIITYINYGQRQSGPFF